MRPQSSPFSRFCYGLSWTLITAGGVAGLLFSLYRNDVLLALARDAGSEQPYLALERRLLGAPGWGTPRSLLAEDSGERAVAAPAAAAMLSGSLSGHAAAPDSATPSTASPEAPPAPTTEPSPSAASATRSGSTAEGVKILSLEALPTEGSRAATRREAPAASRPSHAAVARAENPAPSRSSRRALREADDEPAPKRSAAKAARAESEEPAAKRVAAAAKKESAPAKPAKSLPPAPANESFLNSAIRSAILKDNGK